MKTASELALEYWNKPPIERVNNTLQDYVYDYMLNQMSEKNHKLKMAINYIDVTDCSYGSFKYELKNILTNGKYYGVVYL